MRNELAGMCLVAVLLTGPEAFAVGFDTGGGNLHLGVSGAYSLHGDDLLEGSILGLEVTGTVRLLGIHWWASQGYRFRFSQTVDAYLHYELGLWALFSVGVGVSFGGGDSTNLPVHGHAFVGLPIPAAGMGDDSIFPGFFLEPYYRPMVTFRQGLPLAGPREIWTHEIGVMFKLTSLKFRWPWEEAPPVGESPSSQKAALLQ